MLCDCWGCWGSDILKGCLSLYSRDMSNITSSHSVIKRGHVQISIMWINRSLWCLIGTSFWAWIASHITTIMLIYGYRIIEKYHFVQVGILASWRSNMLYYYVVCKHPQISHLHTQTGPQWYWLFVCWYLTY